MEDMDWLNTAEGVGKVTNKFIASKDGKDLRTVLVAISQSNPGRAASAIERFLSDKANLQVEYAAIELLKHGHG